MSDENDELNSILEGEVDEESPEEDEKVPKVLIEELEDEKGSKAFSHCQFSQLMENQFTPCGPTKSSLPPGVYHIFRSNNVGIIFEKISAKIENLLIFPDSTSKMVVSEISDFWEKEDLFKKFKFPHKRGILLWGPPGSGKSSTIQLIIKDVIERNGVVFLFDNPGVFVQGYTSFRNIQPETPIVVIMEDLDEIIHRWGEHEVLQILDGVYRIHKTCFLATTNYPQKLKSRVVNRPSRFDKRYKIDFPNDECRKVYIESIKGDQEIDVEKWVNDTEEFSFAHLKELFIAVKILGNDYDEALSTIKSMRHKVMTKEDEEFEKPKVGFGNAANTTLHGSKIKRYAN